MRRASSSGRDMCPLLLREDLPQFLTSVPACLPGARTTLLRCPCFLVPPKKTIHTPDFRYTIRVKGEIR